MLHQKIFTFNPFSENTYLLYNDEGNAIIIDPGCSTPQECSKLANFIQENKLKPVRLLLTHAHLDHILGNDFIFRNYGLAPYMHRDDLSMLHALVHSSSFYGLAGAAASPEPAGFLNEGDTVRDSNIELQVLYVPGHSAGSICFYSPAEKKLWCGDVLFNGSIGRTDLPGGDFDTLAKHIRAKLFTLPDDIEVFSGHGMPTTIGIEKKNNPFVGEVSSQ
jgi:hydroxyacylglutathione hydrolase